MTTTLFEVSNKYFDILTWVFHTEKAILGFLSNFPHNMWVFAFLIKCVARECVTMVTNHTVTLYRITRTSIRK